MESGYRTLFAIEFFHEFYKKADNSYSHRDEDFNIIPTQDCETALKNQGLLFRRVPGGFIVLYKSDPNNSAKPLIPLTDTSQFRFLLTAKSPNLVYYSDLPLAGERSAIYYLHNRQSNIQDIDGTDELLLVQDTNTPYLSALDQTRLRAAQFSYQFSRESDTARLTIADRQLMPVYSQLLNKLDPDVNAGQREFSAQPDLTLLPPDLYTLAIDGEIQETFYLDSQAFRRQPFGLIDIFSNGDVPEAYRFIDDSGQVTAKTYSVRINNRATIWRYFIGLKYRNSVTPEKLDVVSSVFSANFTRKTSITLADSTQVIPFDSGTTKIPLKKAPLKGFTLKRDITTGPGPSVFEETPLPNPEITNIATETGSEPIYSQVYFYI
ncbi:hypothetical protein SG34_015755 [Thalassomonas viridans]|uniref:Uncharacterized protein n=1 Tax=Thalassomonas viridans TaxID=137584 RepID=A0AAE9YXT4_9GAMM|nr:hypothetical protein [Thalassomonas viridans]WDE02898.1 hypothetical protein SG34_015755 [Thalassomonas viridans]